MMIAEMVVAEGVGSQQASGVNCEAEYISRRQDAQCANVRTATPTLDCSGPSSCYASECQRLPFWNTFF